MFRSKSQLGSRSASGSGSPGLGSGASSSPERSGGFKAFRKASSSQATTPTRRHLIPRKASEGGELRHSVGDAAALRSQSFTDGQPADLAGVNTTRVAYTVQPLPNDHGTVKMAGLFSKPRSTYLAEVSVDNKIFDAFQPVPDFSKATLVDIAAGESHLALLDQDRRVHVRPQQPDVYGVVPEEMGPGIQGILCGNTHTVAWRGTSLFTWGSNDEMQLGRPAGSPAERVLPKAIVRGSCRVNCTILLMEDGSVMLFGQFGDEQLPKPTPFPFDRKVVSVATGGSHCVIVTDDGCLFGWGSNTDGQLGEIRTVGERSAKPVQMNIPVSAPARAVACGVKHTIVLTQGGHAVGLGSNEFGQLGMPGATLMQCVVALPYDLAVSAVDCGDHSTSLIDCWGRVWVFGKLRGNNFLEHTSQPRLLADRHDRFNNKVASGTAHVVTLSLSASVKKLRTVQQWCSSADGEDAQRVLAGVCPLERHHFQNTSHAGFLKSLKLPCARCSESELVFLHEGSILTPISEDLVLEGFVKGVVAHFAPADPEDKFWRYFRLAGSTFVSLEAYTPQIVYVQLSTLPAGQHVTGLFQTGLQVRLEVSGSSPTRLAILLRVHSGPESGKLPLAKRMLLGSPTWLLEDLEERFSQFLCEMSSSEIRALAQAMWLTEAKRLDEAQEELFFSGMARIGQAGEWLHELFLDLARLELVEILKPHASGDGVATAFRSKSAATALFRGMTRLPDCIDFANLVSESLQTEGVDVRELVLNLVEKSPPASLINILRALLAELRAQEMLQPERLVAFFFFTRYLVPLLIANAPPEHRSLIMSYAKEIGALVAEDSINVTMERILASAPPAANASSTKRATRRLLSKALGMRHDEYGRAGCLSFLHVLANSSAGQQSNLAHIFNSAVARAKVQLDSMRKASLSSSTNASATGSRKGSPSASTGSLM